MASWSDKASVVRDTLTYSDCSPCNSSAPSVDTVSRSQLCMRCLARSLSLCVCVFSGQVKALPWFHSVREKLLDPAYSSWFLRFDPQKKGNYSVHTGSPKISAQCE